MFRIKMDLQIMMSDVTILFILDLIVMEASNYSWLETADTKMMGGSSTMMDSLTRLLKFLFYNNQEIQKS